jgi:hypothetical protein
MIYCQDCGAANDVAGTFCRICGQGLSLERGSQPCPACSQPLANQASFCSSCGMAVTQAPAAQPAHNFAFAGAATDIGGGFPPASPPLNPAVQVINESLELPDWLKRAAAEQPQDSSQATDSSFMYHGVNPTPTQAPVPAPAVQPSWQQPSVVETPPLAIPQMEPAAAWLANAAPTVDPSPAYAPSQQPIVQSNPQSPVAPERSMWPSQIQPKMAAPVAPSPVRQAPAEASGHSGQPRKLVSTEIPNGGLDLSMPTWLNQPPQTPAVPVAPPTPQMPATAAAADTTSFISESDLPAWIRQLAEADEQRKAQAATEAATAAVAGHQPAPPVTPPPDQDLFGEGSLARRISQLPGEAEPPSGASNPWLNRHDGAEGAQADVWSRPKADSDRRSADDETYAQPAVVTPTPSQVDQTNLASESASTQDTNDNKLRLALLIAAVISVAAIAAYLFMTGSL